MTPTPAEFDVIVWGATGFTGRLVAEYLARTHPEHRARVALAGRDRAKVEAVRDAVAARFDVAASFPILVADAADAPSLRAMVARGKVVCSTVGPYARYGSPLVAACVAAGVDYCDLTAEVHWVRRMIDEHHEEARRTGARIVHGCGFDSVPSDLGVLMLQDHATRHHGAPCAAIHFYMGKAKGGPSGGTLATVMAIADEMKANPAVRRLLANPYALDPDPGATGPDGRDQLGVAYSDELGQWTGPFVMAASNTRLVRRSHALLGHPWGRDFRYSEVMSFGPGPRGLARAVAVTGGLGAAMGALGVPPLRRLLQERVLPKPGEGPSAEVRERGYFEVALLGDVPARQGRGPVRLRGTVVGKSDPGYGETAKMLGESALCLALDPRTSEGGDLTPAVAMGLRLVERLRAAGMDFDVREEA